MLIERPWTRLMSIESAYHADLLVLERGIFLDHTSRHVDVDGLVELGRAECITNVDMMNFPLGMLWHHRHKMPDSLDATDWGEHIYVDVALKVPHN